MASCSSAGHVSETALGAVDVFGLAHNAKLAPRGDRAPEYAEPTYGLDRPPKAGGKSRHELSTMLTHN